MIGLSILAALPVLAAAYYGYRRYRFSSLMWPEQLTDEQLLLRVRRYLRRHGWVAGKPEDGRTSLAASKGEGTIVFQPLHAPGDAAAAAAAHGFAGDQVPVIGLSLAPLEADQVAAAGQRGIFALHVTALRPLAALPDAGSAALQDFFAERGLAEPQTEVPDIWAPPGQHGLVAEQLAAEERLEAFTADPPVHEPGRPAAEAAAQPEAGRENATAETAAAARGLANPAASSSHDAAAPTPANDLPGSAGSSGLLVAGSTAEDPVRTAQPEPSAAAPLAAEHAPAYTEPQDTGAAAKPAAAAEQAAHSTDPRAHGGEAAEAAAFQPESGGGPHDAAADSGSASGPAATETSGAAASAGSVRDIIERARRALEARMLDEAESSFRAALAIEPLQPAALSGLATTLNHQGRLDEAISTAQAGVQAAPRSVALLLQLGNMQARREDWEAARGCYEQALTMVPHNVAALAFLATAQLKLGQPADAVSALNEAVALEPGTVRLHVQRGHALLSANQPAEAEQAFRQALSLEPGHAGALTSLVNALLAQDKTAAAVTLLEERLAANPGDARLRERLRQIRPEHAAE